MKAEGDSDTNGVTDLTPKRIKSILDEADTLEGKSKTASIEAEDLRWEAARLMAEAVEKGTPQKELAEEIGRSTTVVNHYIAIWKEAGLTRKVMPTSFAELLHVRKYVPKKEREQVFTKARQNGRSATTEANRHRAAKSASQPRPQKSTPKPEPEVEPEVEPEPEQRPLTLPRKGTRKHQIIMAAKDAGPLGVTDRELADKLGVKRESFMHARRDLVAEGWLVDGDFRFKGTPQQAAAWMISVEGAKALGMKHGWTSISGRRPEPRVNTKQQIAARVLKDLEDPEVMALTQSSEVAGPTRARRLARHLGKQAQKEQERELREKQKEAERLAAIKDEYEPAHTLYAKLTGMQIDLGGYKSAVRQAPHIFASRPELADLAADVATAADYLEDELRGKPAPAVLETEGSHGTPIKPLALPPSD